MRISIPFALVCVAPAQAPLHWHSVPASPHPSPRYLHAMAADTARGCVVLFGGSDSSTPLADTWEWRGGIWTLRQPSLSPPARSQMAMAFDPVRRRVVLFGGSGGNPGAAYDDTWEYDGTTWSLMMPTGRPPARAQARMTYDPARRAVVLFGGNRAPSSGLFLSDTWTWDGTTWQQMATPTAPAARDAYGMALDPVSGRVVLFGGFGAGLLGDTWAWDASGWLQLSPGPSPRHGVSLAWHQHASAVVAFGGRDGSGNLSDLWVLRGSAWTQAAPASGPGARWWYGMAEDPAGGNVLLHGGDFGGGGPLIDDAWDLAVGGSWTPFGSGCAGSAGLPTITPILPPRIGRPFSILLSNIPPYGGLIFPLGLSRTNWHVIPLPLDLGPLGMPGCSLLADGSISPQPLLPTPWGAEVWGRLIPNNPALIGVEFFQQAFYVDPTANAAGVIVSNGGHVMIGS